jgi:hypothetical protein
MSSNLIIPPSVDAYQHIDLENGEDNGEEDGEEKCEEDGVEDGEEVLEVSPTPGKAKRKAKIILEKPNKKAKTSSGLVIQGHISKILESAQAFVSSKLGGITIDEVMGHVIACGADIGTGEHFVATELFVKK